MIRRVICTIIVAWIGFLLIPHPLSDPREGLRWRDNFLDPDAWKLKENRDRLIGEVQRYMDNNYPDSKITASALVDTCIMYRFDICFALAQASIESHMGTRGMATRTNSPWNVMAYDGWDYNDLMNIGAYYLHPNESIAPYIRLVQNEYLFGGRTVEDLLQSYTNKNGHRYASNPDYEDRLRRKYFQIKGDTNIWELQNNMVL